MDKDQLRVFLYKPVNPAKGQSNSKINLVKLSHSKKFPTFTDMKR